MKQDFLAHGFKALSPTGSSYYTLKRGDVLLNEANHTALYIGSGQIVHARSSEGTADTRDNSGNEIRIQSYYDGSWDVVLRYAGSDTTQTVLTMSKQLIPNGTKGKGVAALQGLLIFLGYDLGYFGRKHDGIDGDAGTQSSRTNSAIKDAVSDGKLAEEDIQVLLSLNSKE